MTQRRPRSTRPAPARTCLALRDRPSWHRDPSQAMPRPALAPPSSPVPARTSPRPRRANGPRWGRPTRPPVGPHHAPRPSGAWQAAARTPHQDRAPLHPAGWLATGHPSRRVDPRSVPPPPPTSARPCSVPAPPTGRPRMRAGLSTGPRTAERLGHRIHSAAAAPDARRGPTSTASTAAGDRARRPRPGPTRRAVPVETGPTGPGPSLSRRSCIGSTDARFPRST